MDDNVYRMFAANVFGERKIYDTHKDKIIKFAQDLNENEKKELIRRLKEKPLERNQNGS